MKHHRQRLLFILILWLLSACADGQSPATPSLPSQTLTTKNVIPSTSTKDVKSTEAREAQTSTPSPVPNLLNSLPSGTYIAIPSNEGSGWDFIPSIHLLSLNGHDIGILAKNATSTASISLDGKEIAYINFIQPARSNLAVVNLQTNQTRYFSISGCAMSDGTVGWSPDRTQVAVSCGDHISIVDITGDKAVLVSALKIANGNEVQLIYQVSWSPDGNYLSFYIAAQSDTRDLSSQVPYLANPTCPNNVTECEISPYPLRIKNLSMKDLSIAKWTPENLLAIAQENHIYLFDPITKKPTGLISIPVDTPILSFSWSPDNQAIAYSVTSQTPNVLAEEIYIIATSGGKPVLVSGNGNDVMFWIKVPAEP